MSWKRKKYKKKENVHPFGKSYSLSVHFGQIAPIIATFSKGLILKNIKCTLQWRAIYIQRSKMNCAYNAVTLPLLANSGFFFLNLPYNRLQNGSKNVPYNRGVFLISIIVWIWANIPKTKKYDFFGHHSSVILRRFFFLNHQGGVILTKKNEKKSFF